MNDGKDEPKAMFRVDFTNIFESLEGLLGPSHFGSVVARLLVALSRLKIQTYENDRDSIIF
jgi:hypothetical protein